MGGHSGGAWKWGCVEIRWCLGTCWGVQGHIGDIMECGDKSGSEDVLECVDTHWVASRHPHPGSSSCSGWRRAAHPLAGCRLPLQQRCRPPRHPQVVPLPSCPRHCHLLAARHMLGKCLWSLLAPSIACVVCWRGSAVRPCRDSKSKSTANSCVSPVFNGCKHPLQVRVVFWKCFVQLLLRSAGVLLLSLV